MEAPMWRRLRESAAASSAGTLERAGADADGDEDGKAGGPGDGDADDTTCPQCGGTGTDGGEVCPKCNGSGSVMREVKEATVCAVCLQAECDVPEAERLREAELSAKQRKGLDDSDFAIPEKAPGSGSYPIKDRGHAANALARSSGKAEEGRVKAAVYKKFPDLKEASSVIERLRALESDLGKFRWIAEAKPASTAPTFSTPSKVKTGDGQEGYRVVLIREGSGNKEDGNWYTADAIREMCEAGICEGMQAYANHPSLDEEDTRPERDVRQLVGHYRDVAFRESGGVPRAEAVFVPLTTNEEHPTYGWVVTLAEAAARNSGPQPLAGISLYGYSGGDDGDRPDGSHGRMVSMIRPSSGDIVTNAGAGGGFLRAALMESAKRRQSSQRKELPVTAAEHQKKLAEAITRLREASTDEDRTQAIADLDAIQKESIDAPAKPIDTVEALTEAAPALVEKLREAAKADAGRTEQELRDQLREAQERLEVFDDTTAVLTVLREAEVPEEDRRDYVDQIRLRRLKEKADILDYVEMRKAADERASDKFKDMLREAMEGADLGLGSTAVEGVFERSSSQRPEDGGVAVLRESGIPLNLDA